MVFSESLEKFWILDGLLQYGVRCECSLNQRVVAERQTQKIYCGFYVCPVCGISIDRDLNASTKHFGCGATQPGNSKGCLEAHEFIRGSSHCDLVGVASDSLALFFENVGA